MKMIEPLNLKVKQLLASEALNPLSAARTQYGSREDYRLLGMHLTEAIGNSRGVVVADLSPFDRVGNRSAFKEFVLSLEGLDRILFIVGAGDFLGFFAEQRTRKSKISFLSLDESACAVGGEGAAFAVEDLAWMRVLVESHRPYTEFRRHLMSRKLSEWVAETLITAGSRQVNSKEVVALDGRQYIRMQTGMVVSSYVNMKAILANPDRLIDLAVEVCWQLLDGFRRDRIEVLPKWIVTPNNTALQLGAAVQAIAQAPLAVIDHIGPVPAFGMIAQRVSAELRGCEVALLTDVSATGGEIDRSVLFLHGLGARIRDIVCPVWLEVGRCQLTTGINFVSLCTPKRELRYEYRSE